TGRGAQAGVLVRDAEALERFAEIDTLVVDKTGTLTEGRPRIADLVALPGTDESEMLALIAALERGSEHPIAEAIVEAALARGLMLADAAEFDSITGKGVTGQVAGRRVALGNLSLMQEMGANAQEL